MTEWLHETTVCALCQPSWDGWQSKLTKTLMYTESKHLMRWDAAFLSYRRKHWQVCWISGKSSKFSSSILWNFKIHLLLSGHFLNFSPSNNLNSWIVIPVLPFYYRVKRKSDNPDYLGHLLFYLVYLGLCVPFKISVPPASVYKNIAWTKWPIKMKFGWPLQKLIGHYKF